MTARRRVAKRPPRRYVEAELEAPSAFAGWWARAHADFPARDLAGLQSGRADQVLEVLGRIVVEHNLPNGADELAETLGDVEPYDGLLEVASAIAGAITKLPPR